MVMETTKIQCESLVEENLQIAKETLNQLKHQDEQLNSVNKSLSNIEYYSQKSKDILKRMDTFFKRLWYRPVTVDITREYNLIQMKDIELNTTNNKEINMMDSLNQIKEIGIKIGDTLDSQNILINNLDIEVDKNKSFLDKNDRKINNLL
tara:strand:+ start:76 stop:525 length:450 start_codon:yes stop_codon:yes gene_type:complete